MPAPEQFRREEMPQVVKAPPLALSSGPSALQGSMTYLHEHGHPYADRMISYPNAGHLFIVADRGPSSALNSVHEGSFEMLFGGTPDAGAAAIDSTVDSANGVSSRFEPTNGEPPERDLRLAVLLSPVSCPIAA